MFKGNTDALRRLRKYDEIVKFDTITYEELTSHVDTRNVLLKFQETNKSWTSKSLVSVQETVNGFEQNFLRIYDTEEDVYIFQKTPENKPIKVENVLKGDVLWEGDPDTITGELVLKWCDLLVETVSF